MRNEAAGAVFGHLVQVGTLQGDIAIRESPRVQVVPQQVPPANPRFTGRANEQAAMSDVWAHRETGLGGTPSIVAIDGMGGIGKTSLAVHWAHRNAAEFPDGSFYVNLRGFDPQLPAVEPQSAINELLNSLGVPPREIPPTYVAQEALYRSLLADRSALILLDNVRSVQQVRPLLPAATNSMVIVTSRTELTSLVAHFGARVIKLAPLSLTESEQLLRAHLGSGRVMSDRASTRALVDNCARLPLALSIVAARAAARPGFELADIADELNDESSRLDYFNLGEIENDIRAVFSWSSAGLSDQSALLFRLIGFFAGPDISLGAAASLIGTRMPAALSALGELARANLIEEYRPHRYRFHDLVRVYAAEQAQHEDPGVTEAAVRRLLDHYLHTSAMADHLLDPPRRMISLDPPTADVHIPAMSRYDEALTWFDDEHRNILHAAETSSAQGCHAHTWRLAWAANTYFYWRSQWNECVRMQRLAVHGAQDLGDPTAEAKALRGLGRALARLGEFAEARECHQRVLDICTGLDDRVGQATTHHALSFMFDKQGDLAAALHHAEAALPLWRAEGNRAREARALSDLGWAHFRAGSAEAALQECREALALFTSLANPHGETLVLQNLTRIGIATGQLLDAALYAQQQIALESQLGNRISEASAYDLLGDIRYRQGQENQALEAWRASARILSSSGRAEARTVEQKIEKHTQRNSRGRSQ
ncbi:ATP-binding protein [Streptomyces sp. NPDC012935]|uniref:ATP-binding protein n=1 Tax=Streptomyces sp. NPDC012935 TaxID=3364857 RepID=UPI0036C348BD